MTLHLRIRFFCFPHARGDFSSSQNAICPGGARKVPRACWTQLTDKEVVGMSEPVAKDVTKKEAEG